MAHPKRENAKSKSSKGKVSFLKTGKEAKKAIKVERKKRRKREAQRKAYNRVIETIIRHSIDPIEY
jgi:hypothetical protein